MSTAGASSVGGAFSRSASSGVPYSNTTGSSASTKVTFKASASTATYVDSGKVYPLSLALNFIIKA